MKVCDLCKFFIGNVEIYEGFTDEEGYRRKKVMYKGTEEKIPEDLKERDVFYFKVGNNREIKIRLKDKES